MNDPSETPWVLIRRDKPRTYFGSLDGAKKFYDQLRFNGGRQPDAAIFGPGGESWYCRGSKEAYWVRDDERRKREVAERRAAGAVADEDAA
jgi:hypothetical protein